MQLLNRSMLSIGRQMATHAKHRETDPHMQITLLMLSYRAKFLRQISLEWFRKSLCCYTDARSAAADAEPDAEWSAVLGG